MNNNVDELQAGAAQTATVENQVNTTVVDITIAKNDNDTLLYNIKFKDKLDVIVDGVTVSRDYLWFSKSHLKHNLSDCDSDFDLIIADNLQSVIIKDDVDYLPLSLPQAKAFLVGAKVKLQRRDIGAGEVIIYNDVEYVYENSTIRYEIIGIELTAKAQRRLDAKIDKLI